MACAVEKNYPVALAPKSDSPPFSVPSGLESVFREKLQLNGDGLIYLTPTLTDTKGGESLGAVQLANLFASHGFPVRATTAALLTWEDFRQENLILLGHNEQNTWMDPLLADYPLRLQATSSARQRRIVNTAPEPGEAAYYEIDYASKGGESTTEYALVSMIPGTDGLHQLLLVSGLNTQATLMTIEFLTNEERVEQLIVKLRQNAPRQQEPRHFQLVLRADVREGVPTGGSIEQIRLVKRPQALAVAPSAHSE